MPSTTLLDLSYLFHVCSHRQPDATGSDYCSCVTFWITIYEMRLCAYRFRHLFTTVRTICTLGGYALITSQRMEPTRCNSFAAPSVRWTYVMQSIQVQSTTKRISVVKRQVANSSTDQDRRSTRFLHIKPYKDTTGITSFRCQCHTL